MVGRVLPLSALPYHTIYFSTDAGNAGFCEFLDDHCMFE